MNERLTEIICNHKQDIPLIFCGHYHASSTVWINKQLIRIFSWNLLFPIRLFLRLVLNIFFDSKISLAVQEYYRERRNIPGLIKKFDIKIIPAPGGMLGFGGGFLLLDMGTLKVTKY